MKNRTFFRITNLLLFLISCLLIIKHEWFFIAIIACTLTMLTQIPFLLRASNISKSTKLIIKPMLSMIVGAGVGSIISMFRDDIDPSKEFFWLQFLQRFFFFVLYVIADYIAVFLFFKRRSVWASIAKFWRYMATDIAISILLKRTWESDGKIINKKMLEIGYPSQAF